MPDTVLEQAPWRATRKSSAESTKRRNHEQLELSSTSNEKTNCQGVQEDGGEEGDEEETKAPWSGGESSATVPIRSSTRGAAMRKHPRTNIVSGSKLANNTSDLILARYPVLRGYLRLLPPQRAPAVRAELGGEGGGPAALQGGRGLRAVRAGVGS
ncbi:unnamed protein product [Prorocentrum cordatum]|uniref:Uncharacterized protein n=1 Tax=Prorocentrum cordatum TaxID=2364126 RepID=A0ABN9XE79_9DINO|nr:unnamed protein product [Polarella glacialis]